MKIYISADIEGVTGTTTWDETEKKNESYLQFAEQMTREVSAACRGGIKAGATEIWVKDAHATGRNIDPTALPNNAKLIRGWSGHPFSMVQGLDESFDALIFIGYHSSSGSNGNPLSHTMNSETVNHIKINDTYASEFLLYGYAAASVNVPIAFLSGDKALCDEIKKMNKNIETLAVKEGIGNSTISINPNLAVSKIEEGVEKALKGDLKLCKLELPKLFKVEISFKDHTLAYKSSFYPGMKQISPNATVFESDNILDVLTIISFIV